MVAFFPGYKVPELNWFWRDTDGVAEKEIDSFGSVPPVSYLTFFDDESAGVKKRLF